LSYKGASDLLCKQLAYMSAQDHGLRIRLFISSKKVSYINYTRDWTLFVKTPIRIIIQLFELIMIRDGVYKQFSVIDDGNVLNIDEVKSIIYFICTT